MLKIFNKKNEKDIDQSIKKYERFLHKDMYLGIRLNYRNKTYHPEIQKLVGREIVFSLNVNDRVYYKIDQVVEVDFVSTKMGLYNTKIKITNKKVDDCNTYYTGNIVSTIEKKQLRNHYRLPICTNVSYVLLPNKLNTYGGITKDISVGGMLMESNQFLPKNKQIKLFFEIDKKIYKVNGTIVETREDKFKDVYLHHIRFDNLGRRERKDLHKYIFNEQKRRLKSGSGRI